MLAVVNGVALRHADDSLKSDRDAVLLAIAKNGIAMVFADESLECDRDFFLAAVAFMSNWDALYFASASATSSWLPWRQMTVFWGTPDGSFKRDRCGVLAAPRGK